MEFSARWHDNINKNFSYFIGGNVSFNKNKVVSLNGGLPYFDGLVAKQTGKFVVGGIPLPTIPSIFLIKVLRSRSAIRSSVSPTCPKY